MIIKHGEKNMQNKPKLKENDQVKVTILSLLRDILNFANIRQMPVHDRKDILLIIILIIFILLTQWIGIIDKYEARWCWRIWVFFVFARIILHTFHYEFKGRKK